MTSRTVVTLLTLVLALRPGVGIAQGVFTEDQYRRIVDRAHSEFWGNARLSGGSIVRPSNNDERSKLPIPYEDAKRVVHYSITAGLAVWCGINHQSYYLAYMQAERKKQIWSDKQLAFVGFLFGISQANVENSFKREKCDGPTKSKILEAMKINTNRFQGS